MAAATRNEATGAEPEDGEIGVGIPSSLNAHGEVERGALTGGALLASDQNVILCDTKSDHEYPNTPVGE